MSNLTKFILLVFAMILGSLLAYFPLGNIGPSASIAIKVASIAFIFFCLSQLESLSRKLDSDNSIQKRTITNLGKIFFFGSMALIAVGFYLVLYSAKYRWDSMQATFGAVLIFAGIGILLLTFLLSRRADR